MTPSPELVVSKTAPASNVRKGASSDDAGQALLVDGGGGE